MSSRAIARSFRKAYSVAVKTLQPFDGICPRDCNLCEERETLMLLPGESELIAGDPRESPVSGRILLRVLDAAHASDEACPLQCSSCKSCRIYESRPIDCRSFPVVPTLALDGDDVHVTVSRTYCPIADKLPDGFIDAVRRAWQTLSPFLDDNWKQSFNDTASTP